jgi:hypothetical protein
MCSLDRSLQLAFKQREKGSGDESSRRSSFQKEQLHLLKIVGRLHLLEQERDAVLNAMVTLQHETGAGAHTETIFLRQHAELTTKLCGLEATIEQKKSPIDYTDIQDTETPDKNISQNLHSREETQEPSYGKLNNHLNIFAQRATFVPRSSGPPTKVWICHCTTTGTAMFLELSTTTDPETVPIWIQTLFTDPEIIFQNPVQPGMDDHLLNTSKS